MKIVNPYNLLLNFPQKNRKKRAQVVRPTPVPNLDDVQPFMSRPDFVDKLGSELDALLASQHIQNPYPYPGNIDVIPSYSAEPPESAYSRNLRELIKHALAHYWKYDPFTCSVKGSLKFAQDLGGRPNHGLTKEEYNWVTGGKLRIVKRARCAARLDVEQARKTHQWMKNLDDDDEARSICGTNFDRDLDEFYGPDGTDLRPIDDDLDEGFSEPLRITTTIISLPNKSPMEEGATPGGIFHDSGISMDEGYAQYSLAHSVPSTANDITGKVPSDWPTFNADVASFRVPKEKGHWLGLAGDQEQCGWTGRRQGPHELHGSRSHEANQMVDGRSSDTSHKGTLPVEVTLPAEIVQRAQEVGKPAQEKVNSESSEAAHHTLDQEQPSHSHGKEENPTAVEELEINEASIGAAHSASEEQPQYSHGSYEKGDDDGLSVPVLHVIREGLQVDNDANSDAHHSIPNSSFTTPVNQCLRQVQQVQMDIPATPETINVHLTPACTGHMDANDADDGGLEAWVPNSPTTDTQKGQSALGRYVQETKSHQDLTRHDGSTMSIDGSESDDFSLSPRQKSPSHPKGHAGFSRAVKLHQKQTDAKFTLNPPPKTSQNILSPSKTIPVLATPTNGNDSASFRPITPFQLGTRVHPNFDSPGTPTPAPKLSKADGKSGGNTLSPKASKAKGKSVMNVFKSPKLGSRSPERARPSSVIAVAPTTSPAGAIHAHRGRLFGGQGLLFQSARKNERNTKNVLNSLNLSSERRSGGFEHESLDDYADELAGGNAVDVSKGPKGPQGTPSKMRPGTASLGALGRTKAAAPAVVPRVRSRDEDEGTRVESVHNQEPRKKKPRRSAGTAGGADVLDAGPGFEHRDGMTGERAV